LAKRKESKSEEFLGKDQFGFLSGRGTRDAIAVMRCLSERSIEFNQDLYVCFIDYEKAFDRVNWRKLMEILHNIGVDWRDRRLIATLYMSQTAAVRLNYELTEPSEVGRGVRQGCLISSTPFNVHAEAMMKEALDDLKEGICVGGELVQPVRYADDQAMTANTEKMFTKILGETNKVAKKNGMKINIKKTKVMKIGRKPSTIKLTVDGEILQQVKEFKYLRSVLLSSGQTEKDIRVRIGMAMSASNKLKKTTHRRIETGGKEKIG